MRPCKDSPDGRHHWTGATPTAPGFVTMGLALCRWCGDPPPPILERIVGPGFTVEDEQDLIRLGSDFS